MGESIRNAAAVIQCDSRAHFFRARARARLFSFGRSRYNVMIAAQNIEGASGSSHTFRIDHEDEHEDEVTGTIPTP
jgi:hypothetical protein